MADAAEFPPELDADYYRRTYPDLASMDDVELAQHYAVFGRKEGRVASALSNRREFLNLPSGEQSVLEIGPFCNPAISGQNVSYFDVLDSVQLKERAKRIGYPVASVPNIDFVDANGDLSVVDRKFSAAFSAHCIEHQPDLIHHLQQVEKLLEKGGSYYLLIPDKRYCFDHFIAPSTIAQVIDAYVHQYRSHRLESVIEHRALTTHNDTRRHWQADHADPGFVLGDASRIKAAIDEYQAANGSYVDVHAWQFTPESFREIAARIFELDYTKLYPARVYGTAAGSNEFSAILTLESDAR